MVLKRKTGIGNGVVGKLWLYGEYYGCIHYNCSGRIRTKLVGNFLADWTFKFNIDNAEFLAFERTG